MIAQCNCTAIQILVSRSRQTWPVELGRHILIGLNGALQYITCIKIYYVTVCLALILEQRCHLGKRALAL